jgi:hypothetical protein
MICLLPALTVQAAPEGCAPPNTVEAVSGGCVCRQGFPFGSPSAETGCYSCPAPCHPIAVCAFPGICVCNDTYHGDGVHTCAQALPAILSLSPRVGSINGGTIVAIQYSYAFNNVSEAYCRFGDYTVSGAARPDSVVFCRAPPNPPGPKFVSIAFDGSGWSSTEVFFEYKRSVHSKSLQKWFPVVLIVVIVFTLFERKRKEMSETPRIYPSRTAQIRDGSKRRDPRHEG